MISKLSTWFAKNRPDLYAVLDIGTCEAKALLILVDHEQAAIIGAGKQAHEAGAIHQGSLNDARIAVKSCELALAQAEAQTETVAGEKLVADRVVIGISGPMLKSSCLSLPVRRPYAQDHISESEARSIVQRAERLVLQQARATMAEEMGGRDIEVGLVDADIHRILIDGYPVTNFLGATGEDVDVRLSNVFAPVAYLAAVSSVATQLDLQPVAILAGACAVARMAYITGRGDAIVIDGGGESTDIVLSRHGGIESIATLPLGSMSLTRKVMRTLGIPLAAAEDVKQKYAAGKLDQERTAELRNALAGDIQTWIDGIQALLEGMVKKEYLPASIYLSGGAAALPDLARALDAHPWLLSLPFAHQPQVTVIQSRFAGLTDSTHKASGASFTVPVALASWAVQSARARTAKTPERLLKTVLNGMGLA
jgi:cell division ATPase FtsA